MVGRAPEGEEPEVTLEVVAPKKQPKPVGVGATGGEGEGEEHPADQILPGEPDQPRSESSDIE
jgi:ATP-dependent Clp protease ATP-binding subunit ClpC